MKKYAVFLIAVIGLLIGIMGAIENFIFMFALIAVFCGVYMVLSDYQKATYILGAYSVIDYVLRNYVTAFASVWDELFLVALICLWIYKWIVYRKEISFKQTPMELSLITFIVVMLFVLIVNSSDFRISIEGFRAVIQYTLWYFVILQLLKDEKGAKNVCIVFIIVAGLMGIHGVIQYIIGVEMPANWVDQNEVGVRTRVYSILTSPNIMGSLMTLASPICVSLALIEKKKTRKFVFVFLALMMISSLVFTFSRGAWIGFAGAVGIYVLIKDKRLIVPSIIFAVLIVVCVPSVGNRITYMLSPEYIESSLRGGRLVRWIKGLKLLETYPVFGVGLGEFGGAVAMNHDKKLLIGIEVVKTFYMDNYYLKTAVETGIVGLSAFVMLMYRVFVCSIRTINITVDKNFKELETGILAGLFGVIIHNWVENVFEVPMMTSCFWLLVAVMMHLWYINYNNQK